MAQVILLASLGGTDFSLIPGQLIDCTEKEMESLVSNGMARRLVSAEPTEIQLQTLFALPSSEPDPIVEEPEADSDPLPPSSESPSQVDAPLPDKKPSAPRKPKAPKS